MFGYLSAARSLGARTLTGWALRDLAIARHHSDDSAGRALYAEALTNAKASGAERVAATVASNLGERSFVTATPRRRCAKQARRR